MKKLVTVVLLTMMGFSVYAAGFRVALQSAKQTGMAHTGVGMSLGPESLFFNPGAVAFGEGGISFTGNAVLANTTFNSPGTAYTAGLEDNVGTPFALYGSKNVSDNLAAGVAVYTPYGNRVEWENDWAGRAVSQSIDLKAIFIQPTVSYKLSDKIGIGAGLIYAIGSVELQRGVPNLINSAGNEPDVTLATDESANGTGFNVGLFVEPSEQFSLGVNYRSKIEVDAEQGNVTVENLPVAASSLFTATKFDASLPLPSEWAFGAAYMPTEKLTVAFDANLINWSQYEALTFKYDGVLGGASTTTVPQNWEDSWTIKLGGQYEVNDMLQVRAGAYVDKTPVPDRTLSPITPDSDRLSLSFGGTYQKNRFSVDGSILFVNGEERTVLAQDSQFNFGQRYKVSAVVPALGLNYSFNDK